MTAVSTDDHLTKSDRLFLAAIAMTLTLSVFEGHSLITSFLHDICAPVDNKISTDKMQNAPWDPLTTVELLVSPAVSDPVVLWLQRQMGYRVLLTLVFMILHLALLTQYWLVTDRQSVRKTQTHSIYLACIVLHHKNKQNCQSQITLETDCISSHSQLTHNHSTTFARWQHVHLICGSRAHVTNHPKLQFDRVNSRFSRIHGGYQQMDR